MTTELVKKLLDAGVHFGHQTKRWHPMMSKFIFGKRQDIHIIDLEKTAELLLKASQFLKEIASKGGCVLYVGTKKQAQEIITTEAQRGQIFYINYRWLGGALTNLQTIRKSVARFVELKKMKQDGLFDSLSKKEVASLNKEMSKYKRYLEGIVEMDRLPDALFVVDPKRENIAVKEANKLSIPIVSLIDTNCNPKYIDYPIPGNDDALKSIKCITSMLTDAIVEGKKNFMKAEKLTEEEKAEKGSEQKKEEELQKEVDKQEKIKSGGKKTE